MCHARRCQYFEILNRSGLISDGLAETMIRMAKFRNIVVHRYSDVDAAIVIAILHDHLKDFGQYENQVLKLFQGS